MPKVLGFKGSRLATLRAWYRLQKPWIPKIRKKNYEQKYKLPLPGLGLKIRKNYRKNAKMVIFGPFLCIFSVIFSYFQAPNREGRVCIFFVIFACFRDSGVFVICTRPAGSQAKALKDVNRLLFFLGLFCQKGSHRFLRKQCCNPSMGHLSYQQRLHSSLWIEVLLLAVATINDEANTSDCERGLGDVRAEDKFAAILIYLHAPSYVTLPPLQKRFVNIFLRICLGILHWKMAGIFGEFFLVSVSHETKHENSSKNSGRKFGEKFGAKFGDKNSKNRGTFGLRLSWPKEMPMKRGVVCVCVRVRWDVRKGGLSLRGVAFMTVSREPKLNTNFGFLKLYGHLLDIPAKSRDIPPKKFDFPGFEGHTELFGPHPFTWKTSTPPENIRTKV